MAKKSGWLFMPFLLAILIVMALPMQSTDTTAKATAEIKITATVPGEAAAEEAAAPRPLEKLAIPAVIPGVMLGGGGVFMLPEAERPAVEFFVGVVLVAFVIILLILLLII